jgi:AI-2 transport protein TqsA
MGSLPHMRSGALMHLAALVVIIAGMKAASGIIVPFLLAVFLAIICSPALFWLQRRGIPDFLGLVLILVAVVGMWMLFVMLAGTTLGDFSRNVPYYQDRLTLIMRETLHWLTKHGLSVDTTLLEDVLDPGRIMKIVASTLNGLGGMLTNTFLILLIFSFLLLEAAGIPDKLRAIRGNRDSSLEEYAAITSGVNRYLGIKVLTSLVTGTMVFVLLALQKVDFAILWAMCAFLLNFIPNIGSIIAAIPAVLLCLIQLGPLQALITAIGYLAINTVVGSIIEPKVMGAGIGLSPLVVFLSLTFWGWVLGPVGMLLSVPLTMTLKIALGGNESTRWVALLLGSNRDVAVYLEEGRKDVGEKRD